MSVNDERYQRGKKVRESILGPAHAARTAKNRTAFNADFQDFLMEYAWGEIWSRPGLDLKLRSMLTIAMLVAMGRMEELKLHIRATRNTGVTREEVKEIMMHAAIYAGVPLAFGAFQIAAQIFDEMDKESA
ncbi:MAG TPA: 4-carboxymuconolactone decarboxylase [Xanthobacteraceae bacterium]|jgi:4-carboxymuconolactone decarboxylase|nr:4-carboxymuconolactone decarboxylase [Xanthobacteraceae bacterium]